MDTAHIHYEIVGEGKPVFFIHGWSASSDIWARQVKFFSKNFQVITMDLRGHGRSGWIFHEDIFKAMAEDIFNLCKRLRLEDINFVGWSLGAMLILKLIEFYPLESLRSITLVCTTPKFLTDEDFKYGISTPLLRTLMVNLRRDYDITIKAFYRFLFSDVTISEERFNWAWDRIIKKNLLARKDSLMHILQSFKNFDTRHILTKIHIPTLIISAAKDTVCSPGASTFMKEKIPNSRLVVLESGHLPFLTHTDEFNKELFNFLTSL